MKDFRNPLFVLICLFLFAPAAGWAAEAQEPTVMEVIAIDASNASEPYLATYDKFTELFEKQGSQGERSLWANVWAGPNTGMTIVTITYPNMAALAADGAMVRGSEYQALAEEFQEKGFRVASRSIVVQQR